MKEGPQPEKRLSIRQWSEEDRPRERLLAHGAKALTDAELIAILLRSGTTRTSAVEVAKMLLHATGNDLAKLAALSPAGLMKYRGIGLTKAVTIVAALELGMRRREAVGKNKSPRIHRSVLAYEEIRPRIADLPHEEFWVLMLNRGLSLIEAGRASTGGVHGTVADPKIIFRMALEHGASCIVVAHNHPSGQLRPSEEDIRLTRKLVEGGRLLDILVQDHLIVTTEGYYSFADEGQMH